jgi:hypothetical protein
MNDWELLGWALVWIALLAAVVAMADALEADRRQREIDREARECESRQGERNET